MLCDMGLTNDQAATGLLQSSTILMLKLVRKYFLQPSPFHSLFKEVQLSLLANPTTGPFVSNNQTMLDGRT